MNKFIKNVGEFKFLTGMYFFGIVICYMIIGLFTGIESISLSTLWQIIFVSIMGAGTQYVFFFSNVFKKISQKIIACTHFVLNYIILVILSGIFDWFNISYIPYVVGFTVGYIILYWLIFFSFYIYYKAEGEVYNKKLLEYKNNKQLH